MYRTRTRYQFTPGRVLEIGGRNVNGSVRGFFKDAAEYISTDMESGPGVDVVLNATELIGKFGSDSFDTIICCEMLEHDVNFPRTVMQMHAMLKSPGHLIITTPTFGFPLHRYPRDYWRFGEDAFREVFFRGFKILFLEHLDDASGPALTIAAIGTR